MLRKWLKIIIINIVIFCSFLIIIEIAVRNVNPNSILLNFLLTFVVISNLKV